METLYRKVRGGKDSTAMLLLLFWCSFKMDYTRVEDFTKMFEAEKLQLKLFNKIESFNPPMF